MSNLPITFIASFLVWILYGWAIWYSAAKKEENLFYALILVLFITYVLSEVVKGLIPYSFRPYEMNGFTPLTITIPKDGAFPSFHSAFSIALATLMFMKNRKVGLLFILGALIISLGRLLSNVHYPIDILGGGVLGVFSALLTDSLRPVAKKA